MVLGFVLLSISMAFAEGGYGNIIKAFTKARTGHVQVHKKGYLEKPGLYKNFVWNEKYSKALKSEKGVESYAPRVFSGGLGFVDKKTTAVQIKGVDPKLEALTTSLDKKIDKGSYFSGKKGEYPNYEAVISKSLSEILKAELNDDLIIVSQGADGSIANDKFKIVGILSKDIDSLERNTVFMPLDAAQEYLVLEGKLHEIAVITDDYRKSYKYSVNIAETLKSQGGKKLSIEPWEVVEEQFYKSMVADKQGNIITIFIIILIVGVGVLNTVMMSILERMREYGVMKAMGTSPGFIFNSIVAESFFLSLISTVLGIGLSILAIWPMKIYGITYPEPISVGGIFIETINAEYVQEAFTVPIIVIIVTSVLASMIPALKAAKAKPVESMKNY
jgi:ABC-type lipoprotein release transport system permease subunit